MNKRLKRPRKYLVWFATLLLAALFIIPAYVFFSAPSQQEPTVKADLFFSQEEHVGAQEMPEKMDSIVRDASNETAVLRHSESNDLNETGDSLVTLIKDLLNDYRSHALNIEQKRAIRTVLPDINATAEGRALISDLFFYPDNDELGSSIYDMILDAGLKDVTLINEFIDRSRTENRTAFHMRIIDLIADHSTIQQQHSQKIEDYLADMVMHSDPLLKQAALSQWARYVNQHKNILPVLNAYLFNASQEARSEIYEMIETGVIKSKAEKREVLLALESLQFADYLGLNAHEQTQIDTLIKLLSR